MSEIYTVKTFDQIYQSQKKYLIAKGSSLSNFNDGSRVNTVIEAVALTESEMQEDFFRGLKSSIPVSVYNGWTFTKQPGEKSIGKLVFSRATSAVQDFPIPIGSKISLNGIKYVTTEAGTITIGNQDSAQLSAEAETVGDSADISVNAIDTLSGFGSFINQPTGVESATNPVAFTGGTDSETENERIARFRNYVTSLAKSPVSGIYSGVESIDGIKSVTVLENNPSDGWVTIYADDGTGSLSAAKQQEIEDVIKGIESDFENYPGYKAAGIYIQVLAPTVYLVDITTTVTVVSGSLLTDTEIENFVTTALQNYTNALKLGEDWVKSEAVTAVQNANDDVYDVVISVPAGDTVSIASGQLAKTGTISISISRL